MAGPLDLPSLARPLPASVFLGSTAQEQQQQSVQVQKEVEKVPRTERRGNQPDPGLVTSAPSQPMTKPSTVKPRTPKLSDAEDQQTETDKVVYTVTTPASYVYFEKTIAPSPSGRPATAPPRPAAPAASSRPANVKPPRLDKEIDRNFPRQKKRHRKPTNKEKLRIALNSNDLHYFPNSRPYFPNRQYSGVKPSYGPSQGKPFTPTHIAGKPTYHTDHGHSQVPQYRPTQENVFQPFTSNHLLGINEILAKPFHHSLFPSRRKQHKRRPHMKPSPDTALPEVNFHFVEESGAAPPRPGPSATKRLPPVTPPSKGGIVHLLKSQDLTVIAALLEETELDQSIDGKGEPRPPRPLL